MSSLFRTLIDESNAHLERAKLSYFAHIRRCFGFILRLKGAELMLLVHAVVPAVCRHSASEAVAQLAKDMQPPVSSGG